MIQSTQLLLGRLQASGAHLVGMETEYRTFSNRTKLLM